MSQKNKGDAAFPFLSILALIFITLKLTGYITWSWWFVLSPIWVPSAIAFTIMLTLLSAYTIGFVLEEYKRGKK